MLRERQGRRQEPTGCIIDSQIVKCADTVGKATSGYHGGKKITGRGRHLIVDTEGWLLALAVTAASASDKAGARLVTARLTALLSTLKVMRADTGYNGSPLRDWMRATASITLEIVARTSPHTFQVLKGAGSSSAPSAGSCATAASPATTSAAPTTPRP
jgi:transposase